MRIPIRPKLAEDHYRCHVLPVSDCNSFPSKRASCSASAWLRCAPIARPACTQPASADATIGVASPVRCASSSGVASQRLAELVEHALPA